MGPMERPPWQLRLAAGAPAAPLQGPGAWLLAPGASGALSQRGGDAVLVQDGGNVDETWGVRMEGDLGRGVSRMVEDMGNIVVVDVDDGMVDDG